MTRLEEHSFSLCDEIAPENRHKVKYDISSFRERLTNNFYGPRHHLSRQKRGHQGTFSRPGLFYSSADVMNKFSGHEKGVAQCRRDERACCFRRILETSLSLNFPRRLKIKTNKKFCRPNDGGVSLALPSIETTKRSINQPTHPNYRRASCRSVYTPFPHAFPHWMSSLVDIDFSSASPSC